MDVFTLESLFSMSKEFHQRFEEKQHNRLATCMVDFALPIDIFNFRLHLAVL